MKSESGVWHSDSQRSACSGHKSHFLRRQRPRMFRRSVLLRVAPSDIHAFGAEPSPRPPESSSAAPARRGGRRAVRRAAARLHQLLAPLRLARTARATVALEMRGTHHQPAACVRARHCRHLRRRAPDAESREHPRGSLAESALLPMHSPLPAHGGRAAHGGALAAGCTRPGRSRRAAGH